jgi:hypothetical protein
MNTTVGTTRTARIERTPEGIVIVRIFPNAAQSVEDAKENVAAAATAGNGLCALMTDIRAALSLPPETRHYYSGKNLTDYFTALAILVRASPFGRMMGNVYLKIAKPGIPAMLFAEEDAALEWLRKQCPK